VRLASGPGRNRAIVRHSDHWIFFEELLRLSPVVELVEVKPRLNRVVIGQALAAYDLFLYQYNREATLAGVCGRGDAAMQWVCEQRGISVHLV